MSVVKVVESGWPCAKFLMRWLLMLDQLHGVSARRPDGGRVGGSAEVPPLAVIIIGPVEVKEGKKRIAGWLRA